MLSYGAGYAHICSLYFKILHGVCHSTGLTRCYDYAYALHGLGTDLTPERRIYILPHLLHRSSHDINSIQSNLPRTLTVGLYCDRVSELMGVTIIVIVNLLNVLDFK